LKADPRRLEYEQWVRTFAPELYRFAYRLAGNHQVAEDLVQETFVEAWRSLAKQREPGKERAWCYQILRYRYAHFVRDSKNRIRPEPLGEDFAVEARHEAGGIESLAERESLQMALNELSVDVRETFLMVFMQGFKCREAAEELHVPLGTVLSRLSRAREVLRAALESQGKNSGGSIQKLAGDSGIKLSELSGEGEA